MTQHSSSLPNDHCELVAHAENSLRDLMHCLDYQRVNSNILVKRDCPNASTLRGILLGRKVGVGATWDELWLARVAHQVPHIGLVFDDTTGRVSDVTFHPTVEVSITKTEALERLAKTTAIILKCWPPTLQQKMLRKDGMVNRTILGHLFDLHRRSNAPLVFSTVSVDYDTHYKLIQTCLENAVDYSYCRIKDACSARLDVIVNRSSLPQPDMDSVDLRSLTEGFGTYLEERFAITGYLDLNIIDHNCTKADVGRPRFTDTTPKVRTYTINTNGRLDTAPIGFRVWVIDNPISPDFKECLISEMNSLQFMVGERGKSSAFIRNASNCATSPTPIVIGGNIVYASVPLSTVETKILALGNKIATMQYDYVKAIVGSDYRVTFHCNLIHTVVASLLKSMYAPHSDYGQLLCTAENSTSYQHVEDNMWLPKRDEMQVVTMIISNSVLPCSTELVYTDGSSKLATIPLNSCCMHIQGPGSQSEGIQHSARVFGSSHVDGGVWRAAITLRFSVGRDKQPDIFKQLLGEMLLTREPPDSTMWSQSYETTGVISRFETYEASDETSIYQKRMTDGAGLLEVTLEREPNGGAQSIQLESSRITSLDGVNSDRYRQLPADTFHSLSRFDRVCDIQCAGSLAQELSRAFATQYLFKKGYRIQIQEDNGLVVPILHSVPKRNNEPNMVRKGTPERCLPIPGKHFYLPAICAEANLNHGPRSHPIHSSSEGSQPIIVISNGYKNKRRSILRCLSRLDKWEQGNYSRPLFDSHSSGSITIYGSGGAPNLPGSFAPTANGNNRDEPSISYPLSQSTTCPINTALVDMTARNEIVTVYVNESMFLKDNELQTGDSKQGKKKSRRRLPTIDSKRQDPNLCRCLGVFEMYSATFQRDSAAEIIKSHSQDGVRLQQHSLFKEVPYWRFKLRPLLDNESMSRLVDATSAATMKLLTIPRSCSDKVKIYVSTEWMRSQQSKDGDCEAMRDEIVRRFIDGGGATSIWL
jgi:hypothetical protein